MRSADRIPKNIPMISLLCVLFLLGTSPGCSEDTDKSTGNSGTDAGAPLDISICDPSAGPFSLTIDNPYFPLEVGRKLVLEGMDDGAKVRVEFSVLDQTEDVAGITARVVEERETEDDELIEISRNFFAQAPDGTVCYFGEDVDIYQGGVITGHSGQWRAGVDGAKPGIIMPAHPALGMTYKQEVAIGVAEDTGEITAMGEEVTVQAGTYTDTIRVVESSPLDSGTSLKIHAAGVGMIKDDVIELVSETKP